MTQKIVLSKDFDHGIGLHLSHFTVEMAKRFAFLLGHDTPLYPYSYDLGWHDRTPLIKSTGISLDYLFIKNLKERIEGADVEETRRKYQYRFNLVDMKRDNLALVNLIEEFEDYEHNNFKIVEIPEGIEWVLMTDGVFYEYIAEKHRTWS